MKRVKDLAKKTYHTTKNNLPKPVFWSVPILLAFVTIGLIVHLATDRTITPTTAKEAGRATVAVVTRDLMSGGTGVVLKSSKKESEILTNSHVCRVIQHGGLVVTDNGQQHVITGYKPSRLHDLCLIKVAADLKVNTKLASGKPSDYDPAVVSGHPSLLPTVVTEGHFSGHMIVDVIDEITPCTDKDREEHGQFCFFFGGIPKIATREAQLVTATIQAGSSGSAVYDSSGKISGLVFAGSGDLSYAVIVPYEYVTLFVETEQYLIKYSKPQLQNPAAAEKTDQKNKPKSVREISEDCATKPEAKENPQIYQVCQLFSRDMIFHK